MTMEDSKLNKWISLLFFFALGTILVSVVGPLAGLMQDSPLILVKGTEVWKTNFYSLSHPVALAVAMLLLMPDIAWIYAVFQVVRLSRFYRNGQIFTQRSAICFSHMGGGLLTMGTLGSLSYPLVNQILFQMKISPWLGDMPLLSVIQIDGFMAGIFFLILGKIMSRAADLQETANLTI